MIFERFVAGEAFLVQRFVARFAVLKVAESPAARLLSWSLSGRLIPQLTGRRPLPGHVSRAWNLGSNELVTIDQIRAKV